MAEQVPHAQGHELMTDELRLIAGAVHHMYEGPTWHGPSVREALDGVSANDARARMLPEAHSIYELTHHLAAWVGEVERRLRGNTPGDPVDGDFPPTGIEVDETTWRAVQIQLRDRHHALVEAILAFQASRLGEPVGNTLDASLGTGRTYREMLRGVIEHDAYHAGQIVLLRKGLDARIR